MHWQRARVSRRVLAVLLPALLAWTAAGAEAVRLDLHERVLDFRSQDPDQAALTAASPVSLRRRVTFSAYGQQFDLELERNDRLYAGSVAKVAAGADALPVYRGTLRDLPGTWVRLTIVDGTPVGAIWDGSELLLIDSFRHLGIENGDTRPGIAIVRASDIHMSIDNVRSTGKTAASKSLQGGLSPAPRLAAANAMASDIRAIPVGLVLDAGVTPLFTNPALYAIAVTNIVDGIFVAQLDLHLNVEQVLTYAAEPDPFTATEAEALLTQLADLKKSNPALRRLGLVHLLTRTRFDDDTVGIATVGRVCQDQEGVSLTSVVGGVHVALVMAHEIGHNFGAEHDGERGGVCASTPKTYIMAARTNLSREFSACSIQSMLPVINGASCKTAIPLSDISVTGPAGLSPVWYGEQVELDFTVFNAGVESTIQSAVEFNTNNPDPGSPHAPSSEICNTITTSGSNVTCDLRSLYGGENIPFELRITPQITGTMTVSATVTAANDVDGSNNLADTQLEVLPATDLSAALVDRTDYYAQPGWSMAFSVEIANLGQFATSAGFDVEMDSPHQLAFPGDCVTTEPLRQHCILGDLAPGESRNLPFELVIDPDMVLEVWQEREARIAVHAIGTLHDYSSSNDTAVFTVPVVGSIHDLEFGFTTRPEAILIDQVKTFEARIANNGPDAAAGVNVYFSHAGNMQFVDWTSGRGECVADFYGLDCNIGQVASGASVDFSVSYTSAQSGSFGILGRVIAEHGIDREFGNESDDAAVEVSEPAPPASEPPPIENRGSGGGGGSVSIWDLWLHCIALFCCLVRCRRSTATPA